MKSKGKMSGNSPKTDGASGKLLAWAQRRASASGAPEHLLETLRSRRAAEVAAATGLPETWAEGVRSFYDQLHAVDRPTRCTGTACHFAGERRLDVEGVHCFGRCYEAPALGPASTGSIPRSSLTPAPVVLRHLLDTPPPDPLADYDLPSGDAILEAVTAADLRGRGGAAFPTAAKWRAARDTPAPQRYVVANGDEGDPGAYVDRLLLEESPHAVLAGMFACARAIGAGQGIVFVRGEYPRAAERVRAAIAEASAARRLEGFSVRVVRGAGSYVAGEESALLRAIEGLRAEPSPKPPYPAQSGLFHLPTVVQNVETLSIIPWIAHQRRRSDTKAFCLSGAIARPGVVEAPLGIRLQDLLHQGGGGPLGRPWRMALVGGPMGRVVPVAAFPETVLDFDRLSGMGHGGIVLLDDSVTPRALAEHLFRFAASESCGSCAPCRIGCPQLASRPDRASLERLLTTLEMGSLCGFGQGVPRPIRDLLTHFPGEVVP
jgi:NADH:ubiquinone oxidoreductase subunit F (NADH-binding)